MLNKVMLIGHLGEDPISRFTPSGSQVVQCSIATSMRWKDKNTGERKEQTEWHRVVVFGKLADIVAEYLHNGSQVYFEGRLQTRKWQDKQGVDHYSTEIIADVMNMLGSKQDGPLSVRSTEPSSQPASSNFKNDFDNDIPY